MSINHTLSARLLATAQSLLSRAARRAERGDVPGWVLITLMTAGIVTALWVVAKDRMISGIRWTSGARR